MASHCFYINFPHTIATFLVHLCIAHLLPSHFLLTNPKQVGPTYTWWTSTEIVYSAVSKISSTLWNKSLWSMALYGHYSHSVGLTHSACQKPVLIIAIYSREDIQSIPSYCHRSLTVPSVFCVPIPTKCITTTKWTIQVKAQCSHAICTISTSGQYNALASHMWASFPQSESEVIYTTRLSKRVQLLVYFLLNVEVETPLRLL